MRIEVYKLTVSCGKLCDSESKAGTGGRGGVAGGAFSLSVVCES